MKVEKGAMVPLGYGKYFRSDYIVGLEPLEEGRGPGKRTKVFVHNIANPVIASRSEGAILRDMVETPGEITRAREQQQTLADILDTIHAIDPMLRSIIHDQGNWDLNRLAEKIEDILGESPET